MNDNINMDSTVAESMNDNINMDSTVAESMNDNINMDSTVAGSMNDNINMDSTIVGSFILSFIFVIVCGLFEWKQIFADFASFVYICIEIQLSRGEVWDPINQFIPVPIQDLNFKCHMSWSFLVFNEMRLNVVFHFVVVKKSFLLQPV
jgi:hypothetical protein